MKARWFKYILQLKVPGGTSRGVLREKPSWFFHFEKVGKIGIGECGLLPGLSVDDRPAYEIKLDEVVQACNHGKEIPNLRDWPSIAFGWEMAMADLHADKKHHLFPSPFTEGSAGIDINGLVWMGKPETMRQQIDEKLRAGFHCIKLKIGAVDFADELNLIRHIRKNYSAADITIRVDANGAFSPTDAPEKLSRLAEFDLHSIEQPIAAGNWDAMAALCANSPLAIALDEELIGITDDAQMESLMSTIRPQAIILKPSLLGGFAACDQWIALAEKHKTTWWATSALESNIGLNAIAQYTFTKNNPLPQGLGTGQLYTNNFDGPLEIVDGKLFYFPEKEWDDPKGL